MGLSQKYGAFNCALDSLYREDILHLAEKKPPFVFDDDLFDEAARLVYENGGFNVSQLEDPAVRAVIQETSRVLVTAIDSGLPQEVPETIRYALENNAFVFSGFKTFHEMREVGLSMVTDKGAIKPFNTFMGDVKKINNKYNHNYLYAEYNHAVGTSLMAAKWHDFEQNGDRYNLQYRTANDDKVREEHALLHETTLPIDDPFWDKYYPPNGWNCRCTVIQVRKDKYQISDPAMSMLRGDNCTDGAKQKMFRYNPGKTMELFPPKHPYLPKGCGNCTRKLLLSYNPESEKCKGCAIITKQAVIESRRKEYEQLKKDPNYKDVEFDERTGGLKATHIGHNNHTEENECQNLLYQWGHKVILRDEYANVNMSRTPPSLDIEIDGNIMDIKSFPETEMYGSSLLSKNSQLGNVKAKTGIISDCVCLYFDDTSKFSEDRLFMDIEWYKQKVTEYKTKKRINHIFVVVKGEGFLKIYDI